MIIAIGWAIVALGFCVGIRSALISTFKIAYYEAKLKNRGVDISHVENITLLQILRK